LLIREVPGGEGAELLAIKFIIEQLVIYTVNSVRADRRTGGKIINAEGAQLRRDTSFGNYLY